MNYLNFPNKQLRAEVIKSYLQDKKYDGVVCFSCGNATRELKKIGLNVIDVSPKGDFFPLHWFTPSEIKAKFPTYFDATSGHLGNDLMLLIAKKFKDFLGDIPNINYIPTGSGETLVCLKLAYPDKEFIAVYDLDNATEYNENATLNKFVEIFAKKIIHSDLHSSQ